MINIDLKAIAIFFLVIGLVGGAALVGVAVLIVRWIS